MDDYGNVFGSFADGVWRWSASVFGWQRLTDLPVDQFEVSGSGRFYGDFTFQGTGGAFGNTFTQNNGVWTWHPVNGWYMITISNADHLAVSDNETLFASLSWYRRPNGRFPDFTIISQGTFVYTPGGILTQLTPNMPDSLEADGLGNLVGVFNTQISAGQQGTWRWNSTTGWARLSSVVSTIAVSANGTIYENRGAGGIWRGAPGATGLTQISASSGESSILQALPDGSLFDNYFLPGQTHHTGWYYNATLGWRSAIADIDTVSAMAAGKDGEVFFDAGTLGTRIWSFSTTYRPIGDKNPGLIASQR